MIKEVICLLSSNTEQKKAAKKGWIEIRFLRNRIFQIFNCAGSSNYNFTNLKKHILEPNGRLQSFSTLPSHKNWPKDCKSFAENSFYSRYNFMVLVRGPIFVNPDSLFAQIGPLLSLNRTQPTLKQLDIPAFQSALFCRKRPIIPVACFFQLAAHN